MWTFVSYKSYPWLTYEKGLMFSHIGIYDSFHMKYLEKLHCSIMTLAHFCIYIVLLRVVALVMKYLQCQHNSRDIGILYKDTEFNMVIYLFVFTN